MKKLKPFNLERALAGDTVVARDGRKVIALHYWEGLNHPYPVHVYLEDQLESHKRDYLLANIHKINGEASGMERSYDLFMAPKIQKLWLKVYINETCERYITSCAYSTKEELIQSTVTDEKFKIVEIEIEVECD